MAQAAVELSDRLDDNVWSWSRADGLRVVSERIDSARSVALGIWIQHGGAHDSDSNQGLAHLLEHLVFKGTRTRTARQLALEIEQVGGSLDAYTGHDHTGYLARVPDRHLDLAIDVLSDLVYRPLLLDDDLELERAVILEELAAVEDTPEQLAFELQSEQLYDGHPYGRSILGAAETVTRAEIETLRELHSAAYVPGNCVVAAAGQLVREELVGAVERFFPGPAVAKQGRVPAAEPTSPTSRVVDRPGGRQSHVLAGARAVKHSHPLRYALILVETALGAGMSSRLFQRIREERGLAYSVYSYHAFFRAAGHVGAYVGTRPDMADRAREELTAELRSVAETGFPESEVLQTKEQLKGQLLLGLESTTARMQRLAGLSLYGEPYVTLDELADRIDGISAEEVAEAAEFFHPDRMSMLELRPA